MIRAAMLFALTALALLSGAADTHAAIRAQALWRAVADETAHCMDYPRHDGRPPASEQQRARR